MLKITSNLSLVLGQFSQQLRSIATGENKDKMVRTMATTVAASIKYRVHTEGKKTDGGPIGQYRNPYLAFRQRTPYNRTCDTKMIFSLTRQMENDFFLTESDLIKTSTGYGLGFKNLFNAEKAESLQYGTKAHTVKENTRTSKKGKKYKVKSHNVKGTRGFGEVYMPSQQETEQMRDVAEGFIKDLVTKK